VLPSHRLLWSTAAGALRGHCSVGPGKRAARTNSSPLPRALFVKSRALGKGRRTNLPTDVLCRERGSRQRDLCQERPTLGEELCRVPVFFLSSAKIIPLGKGSISRSVQTSDTYVHRTFTMDDCIGLYSLLCHRTFSFSLSLLCSDLSIFLVSYQ
jgi:hypothetical protein